MAERMRCDTFRVTPARVAGIYAEPRSGGRGCQAWMAGDTARTSGLDS